ncbi:hypothetical protein D3C74_50300 [compost metagenome]
MMERIMLKMGIRRVSVYPSIKSFMLGFSCITAKEMLDEFGEEGCDTLDLFFGFFVVRLEFWEEGK